MRLKERLIIMNFFQFFVWGAWLITIANYWFGKHIGNPSEFGKIFTTLGISAIFMPMLTGIMADRWIRADRLYAILHLLSGTVICCIPMVKDPHVFFWVMLLAMLFYMPTIALSNSVAYHSLKRFDFDLVKTFPPIRVWGTVGFIIAMCITNLSGGKASELQFYISAAGSLILGIYSFTLPACEPMRSGEDKSWKEVSGLTAFRLFTNPKMALFFLFAMLLGAALQLTNMYGDRFVDDFKEIPAYADSFVVKYSTVIMAISQLSETLFILAIPFFLRRFGIRQVMLFSMVAWILRFVLLAYCNPEDGLWMLFLSCIVYGMAFDFFNISGSLFVETQTNLHMRASAQGLFMMMVNGFGAILGSQVSGYVIESFFQHPDGSFMWKPIWLSFAGYAAVVTVLFMLFFRHRHERYQAAKD